MFGFSLLAASSEVAPVVALMALVLGAVVLVSLLLIRFKQSLLVGYFICGVILANTGVYQWLGDGADEAVSGLSELGIVLLMFTLGIEFSIRELLHLRRVVIGGGGLQMLLSAMVAMVVCWLFGVSGSTLLVVGFALALSSTAVSIKSFQDLGQPDTPGARMALGIAIFQDLAVIVFMVVLPSIIGDGAGGAMAITASMCKGLVFLLLCWLLSRLGIPHLLHAVASSRSRELFTVTVVALCAAIAWLANWFGLSLALGAFATGLVVSESIYSHRVLSDILPFKDLFLTVFFVSIGLMIDLSVVQESWWIILSGVAGIILVKGLIVLVIGRWMGLRLRQALLAGAALSSSGEFSLVLMNRAADLGGLAPALEQILLACTAVSMALVPGLMRGMIPLSAKLEARGWGKPKSIKHELSDDSETDALEDHVVICGYGPVGQKLHDAMERASIPVVVLEMNADTVRDLHQRGVRVMFADATKEDTMSLAKVNVARAIAYTFPEPRLACDGIRAARELNPAIVTYARAKFSAEVKLLKREGVHHIFHDEVTSGEAMVQAVLGCYSVDI